MLAICNADAPVAFKAPKPSLKVEKNVTQGTKLGATSRQRKKQIPFTYNHPQPKIETTKGVSSTKGDTGSRIGHSVKEVQSSSAMDSNPIQPSASTHVVAELHKEAQQATGGPTSLVVTSEEGANPQLSSGMSISIHSKPMYSASIIIHSEFASKHDVSANSKAGADSGLSAPKDSISQTTGNDEGPNKLSLDHMFAGTNPSVLVDKTKSTRDGLKTAHTETCSNLESNKTEKESKADEDVGIGDDEFNTSTDISNSDDTTNKIKLDDLSKLVQNVGTDFMDSPEYDKPIIVQDKVMKSTQLLVLQTLNSKLIREKEAADAEAGWFKAQPSYPNVEQLTYLLWELPAKFLYVPTQVASVKAKIKTLDALPSLLNKATEALNKFAQVIEYASKKAGDPGVPSAGLAGTHPVEGEKNTQQFIISYPPNSSSQPERELIKKDKGKEAMSSKDTEEEGAESDSDDDIINLAGFMKRIEESIKANAAKQEVEERKEEWIDLLGVDVVIKYYKAKLQYDRYCDKMLYRRAQSRIINYDVLTRKGPITLKVYGEDGTNEVIPNFKASDLHLDPLDRLNDLARKKRKHADDIHDLFRSTKKFKSSVQYGDHPARTVLNEPVLGMILFNSFHRQDFVTLKDFEYFPNEMLYTVQEIFFKLHQGPRLDDLARTFSSLLLAEVDKRNQNLLKQIRAIEQLRQ
ncbi:hypothetical protein Tco_0750573 [Tanacetum coccineum]|uniref:Uncharacterized protein n=1 Tax=Tanacetum coccineum TaxID=301880 RepID=A0ABQ4Z2F8_9ASTR